MNSARRGWARSSSQSARISRGPSSCGESVADSRSPSNWGWRRDSRVIGCLETGRGDGPAARTAGQGEMGSSDADGLVVREGADGGPDAGEGPALLEGQPVQAQPGTQLGEVVTVEP